MSDKRKAGREEVQKYKRHGKVVSTADCHDIVTITVPSGKQFRVHAQLLVEVSDYFLRALNSTCQEATTLSFSLEVHANEVTMAIVVDLICAKAFSSGIETFFQDARLDHFKKGTLEFEGIDAEGQDLDNIDELPVKWCTMLGETWLLADYLQMQDVKNTIMKHLLLEDVSCESCYVAQLVPINISWQQSFEYGKKILKPWDLSGSAEILSVRQQPVASRLSHEGFEVNQRIAMAEYNTVQGEKVQKYRRHKVKPSIADGSEIVTINIPSGKKYRVHAHLLAQYSDYFLKALNSGCQEARTLSFDIEEHASEISTSIIVDWVYAQSFRGLSNQWFLRDTHQRRFPEMSEEAESDDEQSMEEPTQEEMPSWYTALGETWILADYLQIEVLKKAIINHLVQGNVALEDCKPFDRGWAATVEKLASVNWPSGTALWEYHCLVLAEQWISVKGQNNDDLEILQSLDRETLAQVSFHFFGMRPSPDHDSLADYKTRALESITDE
ncbi:hypothetical protein Micbo1qcDRAFT_177606 [Microdochium bolleyi]|uniref:BTB domain-containing protein n=1 Tax=Microdochium bolleyi TaxID=196109 RepID=A0A136IW71_9PEZI|nr:hypothetical protein Micbo1qcDRAFT_177606 [Microdochium bolleyi]